MSTTDCRKVSYYLTGYDRWPGYMPLPIWVAELQAMPEREILCGDYFAQEVNMAIDEALDPSKHTTYDTVEEFLASLKKR